MIRRIYLNSKNFVFDLLFPRYCIGCGAEGSWICPECIKTIDIIKKSYCPECRRPTQIGEFCEYCRQRFALDGIFICANFTEGVLKDAIHEFKYNMIFDIGSLLGKILAGKIKNVGLSFDIIIPVPLHKKRKSWRGFNQAEILGKVVCEKLDIRMEKSLLVRKKYTTPQMELDREGRLKNLKDVFELEINQTDEVKDKVILLVDDITTTGATLEECAKVLKNSGAKSVWAIVLAKGK